MFGSKKKIDIKNKQLYKSKQLRVLKRQDVSFCVVNKSTKMISAGGRISVDKEKKLSHMTGSRWFQVYCWSQLGSTTFLSAPSSLTSLISWNLPIYRWLPAKMTSLPPAWSVFTVHNTLSSFSPSPYFSLVSTFSSSSCKTGDIVFVGAEHSHHAVFQSEIIPHA